MKHMPFNKKTDLSVDEPLLREKVYQHYLDEVITRFRWLSAIIAIAELCLLILDLQNGFFDEHPVNRLNLIAEILLIVYSAFVFLMIQFGILRNKFSDCKLVLIIGYRIIIMAAVLMFAFTDIYVRQSIIGTYLVFLFVLQITPAYNPVTNWIQFVVLGSLSLTAYSIFVANNSNILFGSIFIFAAFAISTAFLRKYFIQQLTNYYRASESNTKFKRLSDQTINALVDSVEAKDLYTKGHSQRVAAYSSQIAKRLGYSEERCKEVHYIGLMHDIGKIGIPDSVINKKEHLTDEEYDEIKKHPVIGYTILKQITELPGISEGARWHHERYDGHGYPDGLAGEQIPEIARIIAVADAYDAMTSNRTYRKTMKQEEVYRQIKDNSGKQFDPCMAEIMMDMIKEDTEYTMHE